MIDEPIGQTQPQQARLGIQCLEAAGDFGARAPDDGIFLDADQVLMAGCQLSDQLSVERLDKTHVGNCGIKFLARSQGSCQQSAKTQQCDL